MCAAPRAPKRLLAAGLFFVTTAARAQGIPQSPAPGPAEPAPPPPAAATPAPPTDGATPAPAFTGAPEPSFTPGAPAPAADTPAAPAPSTAPPYVAPAYPAPPAPPAPSPYGVAVAKPHLGEQEASDAARAADAHIDRYILMPTGETHPAGTAYFSSYEIVGLQAGYALSDRTQLTLSFVPPLSKDPLVPLDLTLKGVLVRAHRVRLAAMASATGLFGFEEGNGAVGRVGAVSSFCFDDGCTSSIGLGTNVALVGPVSIVMTGLGTAIRASRIVSFLVELQSVLPLGRDGAEIHALGMGAGIRLSGKHFGVDIVFDGAIDRKTKPQAIPFLAFTYRFGT